MVQVDRDQPEMMTAGIMPSRTCSAARPLLTRARASRMSRAVLVLARECTADENFAAAPSRSFLCRWL